MQGTIGKIWENQTKDNKTYYVIEIGGEKYSLWDSPLMEGLAQGAKVEYDWKQSGNFRKITGLKKIDLNPGFEEYPASRKDLEIIRMSCLRSASELLQGIYKDPDARRDKALEIAREFEKYVTSLDEQVGDKGVENAEGKAEDAG